MPCDTVNDEGPVESSTSMYAFEATGVLDMYSGLEGTQTTGVIYESAGGDFRMLTASFAHTQIRADDDGEDLAFTHRYANITWGMGWSPSGPGWSIESDGRLKARIGTVSAGTFTGAVSDDDSDIEVKGGVRVTREALGATAFVDVAMASILGHARGAVWCGVFVFASHVLGDDTEDKLELLSNSQWITPGNEYLETANWGYLNGGDWLGGLGSGVQTVANASLRGRAKCDEAGIYNAVGRIGCGGNFSVTMAPPTYVSGNRPLNPEWEL